MTEEQKENERITAWKERYPENLWPMLSWKDPHEGAPWPGYQEWAARLEGHTEALIELACSYDGELACVGDRGGLWGDFGPRGSSLRRTAKGAIAIGVSLLRRVRPHHFERVYYDRDMNVEGNSPDRCLVIPTRVICPRDWFFSPYHAPPRCLLGIDLSGMIDEIRDTGATPILLPFEGVFGLK